MYEIVIKFDLADEPSMFTSTIERFEALQNTVHDKRVVLVANGDKISMALCVTSKLCRAICLGYINANRTTSHPLDDLVQLKILQREYP